MPRSIWVRVLAAGLFVMAWSAALPAVGQEALSAFMQAKLRHAEKTLEGLAKEDYDLIVQHSQAISLLCVDEQWMVLQTAEYKQRSDEFRRTVNAITDAARKKNLDAAALAYVDATMKCISCHKYVRSAKEGR
jgi:cytochrome c556